MGKVRPSQLVVHHVIINVTLDTQEKLFVLTTFRRFIRVLQSQHNVVMERLDKKPTGPGPEISVHQGVTLFLSFFVCVTFFLKETRKAAWFTGDYSTLINRFSSVM